MVVRRFRFVAHHGDFRRANTVPDLPDLQVRNPIRRRIFDSIPDRRSEIAINLPVQQYFRGIADQAKWPARDQNSADDAHRRIQPVCTPVLSGKQSNDGQYRRQCIRQHVQIGRAQIVIVVMCMVMMILVIVLMVWRGNQNLGAYTVDD